MEIITKYFNNLTEIQNNQLAMLGDLYKELNSKVNVISRQDIDYLYERHILHSLAIAKLPIIENNKTILDVGTGGGFPGIPLAIYYPKNEFLLIDSIGKKIDIVNQIIKSTGLQNCKAEKIKSTMLNKKFDFIVSRAVTAFPEFVNQTKNNIRNRSGNGIIYLKGGDFNSEIEQFKNQVHIYDISNNFTEEFFETKKIIYYHI